MTTPENPFFNRGPIFDPAHFFGREREQRRITGLLKNMQNVSIVGLAWVGKTSLLLHLAREGTLRARGLDPGAYVVTYLDLQAAGNLTPERFFHWILHETARQGQRRPALAALPGRDAEGSITFSEFRDALEAVGAAGVRLVYLMDEFDVTTANKHFDLNFFSALRALASAPHLALVTASSAPLHRLIPFDRQAGSPLANVFTVAYLARMEREEIRRLISQLSSPTGISLEPHHDFVYETTRGWPYPTQVLCSILWERLASDSAPLGASDYQFILERFYHEMKPVFFPLWEHFAPEERQTLMAAADPGGPYEFDPAIAEDLVALGPLEREGEAWQVRGNGLARFVRERAAEERANADAFLAVDQADQRATDQVALPSDKRSIYSVVRALVKATEARNPYIRGHSDSTTRYAVAITQEMDLPPEEIEGIKVAARLHDIGHIGVSDLVLLKPGPLTPNETEIVRAHVLVSVHILEALDFPWVVKPAVRSHHERWDGSGYPDGLMGEEIPLGARILAVADVAAAMTAERPWRPALPLAEAVAELKAHAGTKYDPQVIHAFLRVIERLPPGASAPARQGRRGARAHGDET